MGENLWTETDIAAHLGIPPHWARCLSEIGRLPARLEGHSVEGGWDPEAVRVWQRREAARLATRPVRTKDLRLLAEGLRPAPLRHMTKAAGGRTALVRRVTDAALACLSGVGPATADSWQRLRDQGLADRAIARQHGIGVTTVRLVLDGIPGLGSGAGSSLAFRARPLWRRGLSQRDIAAALGVSRKRLRATLAIPAGGFDPRWTTTDATAALGWSDDNVYGRIRSGTFPPPDGHEDRVRWWWPHTVVTWAAANTQPCPRCGARVTLLVNHMRSHAD